MSQAIAALDLGTTSVRCALFDLEGRLLAAAGREHEQHHPSPGQVEHDVAELLANLDECIAEALQSAGLVGSKVA
ncbi:MAG: FGGY family carbohydrate kinase, partial [Planctomycetota bacterium]